MRKNFNLFGIEINLALFEKLTNTQDKLKEILKEIQGKSIELYIDGINFSLSHKIEKGWTFQFEEEEISVGHTFKIDSDEIENIQLYKEYLSEINDHSTFRVIMKSNDEIYFYVQNDQL